MQVDKVVGSLAVFLLEADDLQGLVLVLLEVLVLLRLEKYHCLLLLVHNLLAFGQLVHLLLQLDALCPLAISLSLLVLQLILQRLQLRLQVAYLLVLVPELYVNLIMVLLQRLELEYQLLVLLFSETVDLVDVLPFL